MPVTTRSQSCLLSKTQAGDSQLAFKSLKTLKRRSQDRRSAAHKQPSNQEGACPSVQRPPKEPQPPEDSGDKTPPPDHSGKRPLRITTETFSPSLPISNITKAFWSCEKCSCREGLFKEFIDSCIACGHTMEAHEPEFAHPWSNHCRFVCERPKLVDSVLEKARQHGAVAIRATPQVGKSILLKLLGLHIVYKEPDLEPVYFNWERKEERKVIPFGDYLAEELKVFRQRNAVLRPNNPTARAIYLIDEAQFSYGEVDFWSYVKNLRSTRTQPMFVLVCLFGAVGAAHRHDYDVESQARQMHDLQRIELRPSSSGSLGMLFSKEDINRIAARFSVQSSYQLEHGVADYLYRATDGHPGMVGLLLAYVENICDAAGTFKTQPLSPDFFHRQIVQGDHSFIEWLALYGRGIWTPKHEAMVNGYLVERVFRHLSLADIKKSLREVAMQPDGLIRSEEGFGAFKACHRWGFLHIEPLPDGGGGTKFIFASPLHRRVAYRRLFPGREPDAVLNDLSLREICTNAIARFSPSSFRNRRRRQSGSRWGIPEAAFQNELYSCLGFELHYLPILAEYSHSWEGRIDFYVSANKWGIEVLQCGNNKEIAEHITRFSTGGKYEKWGILDDYIILNFCPRSALREVWIEDEEIRSHVLHVVVEPDDFIAEIYTHDMQLHRILPLSEGRQRFNPEDLGNVEDLDPGRANHGVPLQDEPTKTEGAMTEIENWKLKFEQEREENLQLKMRLRLKQQENREEGVQEEDRAVLKKGRKRKR